MMAFFRTVKRELQGVSIAPDFGELRLRRAQSSRRAVASFAWFDKLTTLSLVEGQETLHWDPLLQDAMGAPQELRATNDASRTTREK